MAARNLTVKYRDMVCLPLKKHNAVIASGGFRDLCIGQPGKPEHAPTPRKQPSVCEHCGELADYASLVKGKEVDGAWKIFTREEVAEAKADYATPFKGVLELTAHPVGEFLANTVPGKGISYLVPESPDQARQYATFVTHIEAHPELAFVGLNTPGSAVSQWVVSVREGVLIMEQRVRGDEVRKIADLPTVEAEPLENLVTFLDSILEVQPYDAAYYEDGFKQKIEELAGDGREAFSLADATVTPVVTSKGMSDTQMAEKLAALSMPTAKQSGAKKKKSKESVAA